MTKLATPETPLADLFAMPVDMLIIGKIDPLATTVTLRLAGGNKIQVHGLPGARWTDVLAEAMELAAEDRRAHTRTRTMRPPEAVCEHDSTDPDDPHDPCSACAV